MTDLKIGDKVIWQETRKWGGKQNCPATFLGYVGKKSISAQIDVAGQRKTVRVANLSKEETTP